MGNYTQDILEHYLSYVDQELKISNKRLVEIRNSIDTEYWKEVLLGIAKDFTISSRYALMRFLYSVTSGAKLGAGDFDTVFEVVGEKKTYCFKDLSPEHALSLTRKEIKEYQKVLEKRALQYSADREFNAELIKKALKVQNNRRTLLSRQEAMELGHILGFNVFQMQWFLLRVFENGAGIKLNSSSDLIDVYGFYCEYSVQKVREIKEKYLKEALCIEKEAITDFREQNWTVSLDETLADKVKEWEEDSENDSLKDELFLEWALEMSPWLDQVSRTTVQVYRDLLAYAYRVLKEDVRISDAYDLYDRIKAVCVRRDEKENTKRVLFDDDGICIDENKCKKVIKEILKDNKEEYTAEADSCKAYRIIKAEGGKVSLENVRSFHYELDDKGNKKYVGTTIRIHDLVMGETAIEKWDLLYLLWYTYNKAYFSRVYLNPDNRFNGLCAFIDCANMILDEAGLYAFYLPHITEQSMVISILEGDCLSPGFIYDELCEAVKL